MKLKQIFNYPIYNNYQSIKVNKDVIGKLNRVGIEVELEQVKFKNTPTSWKSTIDGSLKIEGIEFISVPLEMQYLYFELGRLFTSLEQCQTSSRCSIHVHIDVQDLEEEELFKMIMLYIIYEKCFFDVSGSRIDSNYCTPLFMNEELIKEFIKHPYYKWYKYTAFNLSPIWGSGGSSKLGTVEFRHHQGSTDAGQIFEWCNLISALKEASKTISLDDLTKLLKEMNTTSTYKVLTDNIFGVYAHKFSQLPSFKDNVESGISFAKLVFFNHKLKSKPLIKYKTQDEKIKVKPNTEKPPLGSFWAEDTPIPKLHMNTVTTEGVPDLGFNMADNDILNQLDF